MTSRSLLPPGFVAFRNNFGEIIRDKRLDEGWSQQALADLIGVTRETVLRIERHGVLPRPDTLEKLMQVFEMDWPEFALKGRSDRRPKPFDGSSRGESLYRLGRSLRQGRLSAGLTLREVAKKCGLSAAQLSRLERGECARSEVLESLEEYASLPAEDRPVRFKHPELVRLVKLG